MQEGIWTEVLQSFQQSWLSLAILAGLGIALLIIRYRKKNKPDD